jgi:N-acetyl-anhydromuramyl-L-alanine amidase AmpD
VVGRRTLLVGGGLGLAAAAGVGYEELSRLWWRLPGVDKPRTPGEVDFAGAHWTGASPSNYQRADRPDDHAIDLIVVHVTQSGFRSAVRAFQEPAHRAAAHYVVRRDGYVMQMVREMDIAFHAGNWAYNLRSIGIEHEGYVTDPSFPDAMYRASARLTAGICKRYGFPADRGHVIGHAQVPGTDHTDPGPHWDWGRYMEMVAAAGRGTAGGAGPAVS